MKKDIKPAVYLQKIKNNYQLTIAIKNTEQFCEKISHNFLPIPITIIIVNNISNLQKNKLSLFIIIMFWSITTTTGGNTSQKLGLCRIENFHRILIRQDIRRWGPDSG